MAGNPTGLASDEGLPADGVTSQRECRRAEGSHLTSEAESGRHQSCISYSLLWKTITNDTRTALLP